MLFTPHPISDREFYFSEELITLAAEAENGFVRIDERSVRYPYASSLRKALMRLEAISTIAVDGTRPDLRTVVLLDALDKDGRRPPLSGLVSGLDAAARDAAIGAHRYERLIGEILRLSPSHPLSRRDLLFGHGILVHGVDHAGDARFRSKPYRVTLSDEGSSETVYCPPPPERLPALLDDMLEFANSRRLSPVVQAAVVHFQFQALYPFKTAMDRSGRALCHAILRRRKFAEHIVPTIALVPAMGISKHAKLLMPYRTGYDYNDETAHLLLEKWATHCLECVRLSSKLVLLYMKKLEGLEASWRSRLQNVRNGSAVDVLLKELPGVPIVDTAIAGELTGKSFSATNQALDLLLGAGIVVQRGDGRRNRRFEAPDVMAIEEDIIGKSLPERALARDSWVEQ